MRARMRVEGNPIPWYYRTAPVVKARIQKQEGRRSHGHRSGAAPRRGGGEPHHRALRAGDRVRPRERAHTGDQPVLHSHPPQPGARRREPAARHRHRRQGSLRRGHAEQRVLDTRAHLRGAAGGERHLSTRIRSPASRSRRSASRIASCTTRAAPSRTACRSTGASGSSARASWATRWRQASGENIAVMMRGHGITTASANVRSATIAACFLEESAGLQIRMLSAAGGDAARIRAFTPEEARLTRDQTGPERHGGGTRVGVLRGRGGHETAGRLARAGGDGRARVLDRGRRPGRAGCGELPRRRGSTRHRVRAEPRLPENLRASTFQSRARYHQFARFLTAASAARASSTTCSTLTAVSRPRRLSMRPSTITVSTLKG